MGWAAMSLPLKPCLGSSASSSRPIRLCMLNCYKLQKN
uniref:Uncharacterized protein n=1 Tax=Picea sitchensis TaxID=3332 RepID=A9NL53_PICSI|nr:unknown [Picea sitchensis]